MIHCTTHPVGIPLSCSRVVTISYLAQPLDAPRRELQQEAGESDYYPENCAEC